MKNLFLLILFITLPLAAASGANLGGKNYELNPFTGKFDLYTDKFSQLTDSNTVTLPVILDTSTVIMNTASFENKQTNISSATVAELSVTTGAIKLAQANIEMNGNIQYLSKDKQSYIFFDEVNRWVRYYLEGVEAYRIEK